MKFKRYKKAESLEKGKYLCQDCLAETKKRNGAWVKQHYTYEIRPILRVKKGGVVFKVKSPRKTLKFHFKIFLCKKCVAKRFVRGKK